jgi:hypothetical protein
LQILTDSQRSTNCSDHGYEVRVVNLGETLVDFQAMALFFFFQGKEKWVVEGSKEIREKLSICT